MSKNSRINSEYLYSEGDIDSYVNNVIRYGLGGFKNEHKFLLNNKFGTENNPCYVLYSGAVDSAGKLPLDFFFDKSKQPAPDPKKRDDRKDVFDELMPVMLSEENCKAKILFPYNITNIHWLTGEIVIDKKGDNVSVVIYTHDPYGGGQLLENNFSILNAALHKIIGESGLQVTSVTSLLSPFTNARQSYGDSTSCGVIVADELVRRITDSNLNISSPYPLGAEQLRLSQLTFLQEKLGEENLDYQLFKQQVTLGGAHLEEYLSIESVEYVSALTIEEIREKVEQVVSSEESNTIKIVKLKQVEKEQYKSLIQQLAYKKSQEELKDLVIVLKDLGYLTTKLGELSGELKYYTEAAVFYQYVITILDEKLSAESKNEFTKQELVDPYQQLSHLQQAIFSAIGGNQEKMPIVQEEAKTNKDMLLILRNRADFYMALKENYRKQAKTDNQQEKQKYQELYVNAARKCFEYTADGMKKFLAKLYSDSEQEMAIAPPCKYAVIGLGSMALQQMTPYSDLEFAILTDNEDYQQSDDPKVREYFKNLSHLVNFKVINLGESIIPISKYGLDMSHLVHKAVNLDLGGKTPLGRIDQDKKYDLVQTVDGMMGYVRNEQHWASHIDKNLPHILEKVCYVYGDEQIVQNYQNNIMEFLNKNVDDSEDKLNCQIRALELLEEGTVEIDYLSQTSSFKSKESVFKGDLDKFRPNLDDAEGRLFDVKQEIYRLPDRMVYNLGLYYGIVGDSSWDTVDKLASKGVIGVEAASNLKNAITFASTLRLKTYLHHQAQIEDMSIFAKPAENESAIKEQAKQIFHLPEADLEEQGGLFQYFYTALPLHRRLEKFCDQYEELDETSKQQFFQQNNFYENNLGNQGLIHYRLLQYKEAQSNLEEALKTAFNQNNLQKHLRLMHMLGNAYYVMGQYDQAIEKYQESLEMRKLIYKDEPHPAIADSLNNLGEAYRNKGQYDQAIEKSQESLEMMKLIYKDEPHPAIAGSLNNLGSAYQAKGQYDQAIEKYQESLKIKKLIYKDEPHPDIAASLNNLGVAYKAKGQYDQAIEKYQESLKINKLLYKDEPHPAIAGSLHNLGIAYADKGQYDQAIEKYQESLKINKLIYKDEPHPDIAASLHNLGSAYDSKGQYDQAIEKYQESLKINKLIYKDEPHPDIAASLNNLGEAYRNKGQYDQAIEKFQESLKIKKLIYKDEPHPDIAASLNNLGNAYQAKGQYDQAIEKYQESLKIKKLIYKDEPHPDIAASLNNLGEAYRNKGQYDQAIEKFQESLKDEPHPGNTSMHMAHYTGNKEDIKLLLQYGAEINAKNDEGKTPVHCLLDRKNITSETKLEIIKEFRQLYDMTIKDKANKTVIDYATEHCPELLSLLSNSVEVTVDSSATNPSTSTNDNIDIDVNLLADIDLSKTNQDLPSP
ncbi:tetratricopeptide repeat protein [Candidatus Tisiphia endosymbiont of Piscicola geometra]|uniref:tetratricopeptide repeat protein n=1 Tax=Candidatus Tisiphia endosymbiont of Piscicola geometra TaxID=3066273 RepID=UPI00312CBEFA